MARRVGPKGSDREDRRREYIPGLARSDGACPTGIQKAAERTVCVGDERWSSVREYQTHAAQAHPQIVADDPRNKKVGFEARSGIEFTQLNGCRRNSARGQGERSRSVCRIRVGLSRNLDCLGNVPIRGIESQARRAAQKKITVTGYRQRYVHGADRLNGQPDLERSGIAFRYHTIENGWKNGLNLGGPEVGHVGCGDGKHLSIVLGARVADRGSEVADVRIREKGNPVAVRSRVGIVGHDRPVPLASLVPTFSKTKRRQFIVTVPSRILPVVQTAHVVSDLMGQSIGRSPQLVPNVDVESTRFEVVARVLHRACEAARITRGGKQADQIGPVLIPKGMHVVHGTIGWIF